MLKEITCPDQESNPGVRTTEPVSLPQDQHHHIHYHRRRRFRRRYNHHHHHHHQTSLIKESMYEPKILEDRLTRASLKINGTAWVTGLIINYLQ